MSEGSPCNGAYSALFSSQALQPEQAEHQQACSEGVLTFNMPRWPAVALFF